MRSKLRNTEHSKSLMDKIIYGATVILISSLGVLSLMSFLKDI